MVSGHKCGRAAWQATGKGWTSGASSFLLWMVFPAPCEFEGGYSVKKTIFCYSSRFVAWYFQAYHGGMPSVTPDDHLAAKQSSNRQTARRKQQPRHVKDLIAWWCKAWFPERVWQLSLVISWYGTDFGRAMLFVLISTITNSQISMPGFGGASQKAGTVQARFGIWKDLWRWQPGSIGRTVMVRCRMTCDRCD